MSKKIQKRTIFRITLAIVYLIHTYLYIPGFFILYKVVTCSRISSGSAKETIFNYWLDIFIIIVSYLLIYGMIKLAFQYTNNLKGKVITNVIYILVFSIVFLKWHYIYSFGVWFENTFTTETRIYWGPFSNWTNIRPDSVEHMGPIKIEKNYYGYYKRLAKVFSDINTNDWILTTIDLYNKIESSHWESQSPFFRLRENHIERLEQVDRERLNKLFNREIKNGTVERLFNGKDSLNTAFWDYILADSLTNEQETLQLLYKQIDALP